MNKNNQKQPTRIIHSSHSYDKKYKNTNSNHNDNNNNNNKRENLYRDIFLFSKERDSSEEDDNPEINITLCYDGRKILTKFNRHKTFVDLVKFIENRYFRVGFEENYKIFYEGVEIPMTDKRKINKIVNEENEKEIKFIIKSKGKDFMNSNTNKIYIELENIPSFMDLSDQINNFINSQNKPKTEINYDCIYKDNYCRILFSSSEIAFSFISYMTNIKFNNKYYRKLKIDIKYNALKGNIYKNNRHFKTLSEDNIIKNNKIRKINQKINNNLTIDNNNNNIRIKNKNNFKSRNESVKNYKMYTLSNNEDKYRYGDYFEDNYESVQDSSPYEFEKHLEKMKEMLNKKKWMGNKNFFTSINKRSFNRMIIPNNNFLKRFKNNNFNNNNINEKKLGISPYNDKIYKLKISEV